MNLEKIKAKKLYAEGMNAEEISKKMNKSKGTIYRWIKENKEEFEEARKLAEMTVDDISGILDEAHKKVLLDIIKNPANLKDPKVADALIKIASVLEKLANRSEKEKENKQKEEAAERGVVFVNDIGKEES